MRVGRTEGGPESQLKFTSLRRYDNGAVRKWCISWPNSFRVSRHINGVPENCHTANCSYGSASADKIVELSFARCADRAPPSYDRHLGPEDSKRQQHGQQCGQPLQQVSRTFSSFAAHLLLCRRVRAESEMVILFSYELCCMPTPQVFSDCGQTAAAENRALPLSGGSAFQVTSTAAWVTSEHGRKTSVVISGVSSLCRYLCRMCIHASLSAWVSVLC
jgi:hypothetical protein